jgi:competence protein ComFC
VNLILDLFFPKKCVGCKKIGSYFCAGCIQNIKQTDLVCPKCEKLSIGGVTHLVCRRKFGLDGLWSLGVYSEPLRGAIQKLKYRYIEEASEILVNITLEYWARWQPFLLDEIKKSQGQDWIVVPVPLHWYRQNQRGFNQSALIAKALAQKLGLKYLEVLKRTKKTKQQAKLLSHERSQNIKNAFEITDSSLLSSNPNILLIDDVWTTGSTLRECCFILKKNGAKKVWALTLAR